MSQKARYQSICQQFSQAVSRAKIQRFEISEQLPQTKRHNKQSQGTDERIMYKNVHLPLFAPYAKEKEK
jgi:hypothetical protein